MADKVGRITQLTNDPPDEIHRAHNERETIVRCSQCLQYEKGLRRLMRLSYSQGVMASEDIRKEARKMMRRCNEKV